MKSVIRAFSVIAIGAMLTALILIGLLIIGVYIFTLHAMGSYSDLGAIIGSIIVLLVLATIYRPAIFLSLDNHRHLLQTSNSF